MITAVADSGSEHCIMKYGVAEGWDWSSPWYCQSSHWGRLSQTAHITVWWTLGLGSTSIPTGCAMCSHLNEDMIPTTALVKQLHYVNDNKTDYKLFAVWVSRCDVVQSVSDVHLDDNSPEQKPADSSVTGDKGSHKWAYLHDTFTEHNITRSSATAEKQRVSCPRGGG